MGVGGDAEDAAEPDEEEEDGFSSRCGCGCGRSPQRAPAPRAPSRFEGRGIIARVLRAHAVARFARHSRAARYGMEGSSRISRCDALLTRFLPFSSSALLRLALNVQR